MKRARAEPGERGEMRGGRVPLVLPEAVLGIAPVGAQHEGVARDLREDRRGGDRRRAAIAGDDRPLGAGHAGDPEVAVDQDEPGRET